MNPTFHNNIITFYHFTILNCCYFQWLWGRLRSLSEMNLAIELFYDIIFIMMIFVSVIGNCATMCIIISKCINQGTINWRQRLHSFKELWVDACMIPVQGVPEKPATTVSYRVTFSGTPCVMYVYYSILDVIFLICAVYL